MPMGVYTLARTCCACVVMYIHSVGFCIAYSVTKVLPTTSIDG